MITKAPKGTQDLLPQDSYRWQYVEEKFNNTAKVYGYKEVRFPTFEHTELFLRGVGDTTDVVQKQMYTFNDKGDRSITLRPEGTASVARSFIENGLFQLPMPLKMFYNVPCFRYEKSQKGRLREFHQFGVEVFGSKGPMIDAEVVSFAVNFLKSVGLNDISVNINSIGCPECRAKYNEALKEFLRPKTDELCETCKGRFDRNPLRILDCKSEICNKLCEGAPRLLDYICDDCREHFEGFKKSLETAGIEYKIDDGIVRGLDYYTKTVFEIISGGFTVCGGGRYDGLVEEFGGDSTPAVGFGLGIERLLLRLDELGIEITDNDKPQLYIASMGTEAAIAAQKLVFDLRKAGVSAEFDHMARSLKAQMKYADKLGAKYTIVLGDNEIESGIAKIKDMLTGEQTETKLDNLSEFFGR
ncbi:MAG: histidine--tRNA ligase [Eubacteriales bacterium]|nr:histidine--tRNA ligase [Eubacteriales bacterium]